MNELFSSLERLSKHSGQAFWLEAVHCITRALAETGDPDVRLNRYFQLKRYGRTLTLASPQNMVYRQSDWIPDCYAQMYSVSKATNIFSNFVFRICVKFKQQFSAIA